MLADVESHSVKQLSEPDIVQPIPVRYWWLKRISVVAGVLLVGLVLLRVWWGHEAERRLQATIKHYQDAGQPVLPSEFDAILDAVPDDQNAAILYEKAMKKMVFLSTSGVHVNAFYDDETTTLEKDRLAADELIQKNAEVFALVREARGRPQVAWSDRVTGGMFSLGTPQRSLSRLLYFSVGYHLETGNHAEAVETLHDAVIFTDNISDHPTLISSMVSWACSGIVFYQIEETGASLRVEGTSDRLTDKDVPVSRKQVHDLIRALIDTESARSSMIQAMHAERAFQIQGIDTIYKNPSPWLPTIPYWSPMGIHQELLEPVACLNAVRSMHAMDKLVVAAGESNWQRSNTIVDHKETEFSLLARAVNPFGDLSTWEISFRWFFRSQARRRMAGVALAIRLYEIDHGHRPEALQLLVPDYLEEIPADPFSRDDAPILYKPEGEVSILYSVGYNGEDNDGLNFRSFDDRREGEKKGDIVFYLDGRPDDKE